MPLEIDRSTIDEAVLAKLPRYVHGNSLHLDEHLGAGCAGDPPGYPSYFVHSIYDGRGNLPRDGQPGLSLFDHVVYAMGEPEKRLEELYRQLYRPLPFEHVRVQTWVAATMQHMKHCYASPNEIENGRPKIIIHPLPSYEKEHQRTFRNDVRFSDRWRKAERTRVQEENFWVYEVNAQRAAKRAAECGIDNHAGVLLIRKWYPEFIPTIRQIENPEPIFQTEWVYRYAERPTEENCPGWLGDCHGKFEICRMCGRMDATVHGKGRQTRPHSTPKAGLAN